MHIISAFHDQWKFDTRDSYRMLTRNHDTVDPSQDSFAWHLKQIGHLSRREFDQIDLKSLIDELTQDANIHVFQCRSHYGDIVQHLILLSTAPGATADACTHWKQEISLRRIQFQSIVRRNPSIRLFLPAIFKYGWLIGRMHAVMTLSSGDYIPHEIRQEVLTAERVAGDWNERLTSSCPWSPAQVVGYDATDRFDALTDSYALPFAEPSR